MGGWAEWWGGTLYTLCGAMPLSTCTRPYSSTIILMDENSKVVGYDCEPCSSGFGDQKSHLESELPRLVSSHTWLVLSTDYRLQNIIEFIVQMVLALCEDTEPSSIEASDGGNFDHQGYSFYYSFLQEISMIHNRLSYWHCLLVSRQVILSLLLCSFGWKFEVPSLTCRFRYLVESKQEFVSELVNDFYPCNRTYSILLASHFKAQMQQQRVFCHYNDYSRCKVGSACES